MKGGNYEVTNAKIVGLFIGLLILHGCLVSFNETPLLSLPFLYPFLHPSGSLPPVKRVEG